jgi:TrmH RNA methyltransferase
MSKSQPAAAGRPALPREQKVEVKIFGRNACKALFEHNRSDIIRVYVTLGSKKEFSELLRWCAAERKTYHIVDIGEMERISGTFHHEEVCILRAYRPMTFDGLKKIMLAPQKKVILYTEGVVNPHNQGAILRSTAHFGAAAVIFSGTGQTQLSGAAHRVAEGGAEFSPHIFTDHKDIFKIAAEAGFTLYATSSHEGENLFTTKFTAKSFILMGAEGSGLKESTIKRATKLLTIPGTGLVESLNVSAATAVLLGSWYRQFGS